MKKYQDNKGMLFLLLKNSIVQFIAGILSLSIILIIANDVDAQLIQIGLKFFGYGFFCYLTTPFMIYWLAYVSAGVATIKKLAITVALTALYSLIIWDAYFFFREAIAHGLSVAN
ncbi:hypothetical protein IQ255_19835 [Pleurocapsales cyanobacterium LEGE 10410]|nr:hypothetical protein [Pleurocapsales cyanobacterium LEGE 10410]